MYLDSNDAQFMHTHSALRIRVTAPTDPPISRTFDICQGAPISWLGEAFLLAAGRARPDGPEEQYDWRGDVESFIPRRVWRPAESSFAPAPEQELTIPGVAADCKVEVLTTSSPAAVGEPHVRIVGGTPDPPRFSGAWESLPATFHPEHVQHELTREFGLILPDRETVSSGDLDRAFGGASSLRSLATALPPLQRLALRAHLEDAQLLIAPPIDLTAAQSLTHGLAWLIERIGPEGIEQDEHGWLPIGLAREAEQTLGWIPTPGSPPSPGHALLNLARSRRLVRRLKGRVLPIARARQFPTNPLLAVRELDGALSTGASRYSWSGPRDHAETLALLAIADGTATVSADLQERILCGLSAMNEDQDYPYRQTTDAEREASAERTMTSLMEVLAPLGGQGGYGLFTPAVRAFAHSELL